MQTAPVWGYCRQKGPPVHCGAGMVFSINAVESGPNNFDAFVTLAKRINGTVATTATNGSTGSGSAQSDAPRGTRASYSGVLGLSVVAIIASLL